MRVRVRVRVRERERERDRGNLMQKNKRAKFFDHASFELLL